MKKIFVITIISTVVMATISTTMIISCAATGGGEITGLILFSTPVSVWLSRGGSLNSDDLLNPISGGTEITDATVTITNEDQENSISLMYLASCFDSDTGCYVAIQEFTFTAGEKVAVSITTGGDIYTGASTQTPDSSAIITYPDEEDNEQPFFLSWNVTNGDYPATHTIVQIGHNDPYINKWYVLPIDQTSYQISGLPVDDIYGMGVLQCNKIPFSGGGQITGFVSADAPVQYIIVNITK